VDEPPLKPLHGETALIQLKLEKFSRLSTEVLIDSLKPGLAGALKARPDGTVMDGHHRVKVLRDRGVDVNSLPREIIRKD
jgi:ParB-like chromosome segregation protein Spo0J